MKIVHYSILTGLFLIVWPAFLHGQDYSVFRDMPEWEDSLFLAADRGDTVTALKLIELGVNVNATTYEGVTPLMYAAQNGSTSMVRLLLKHGADAGRKPLNGYAALISSIRSGYVETAEFLVRNGADINLYDNDKVTPLMHAIAVDSFYMADMLLYYGASVTLKDVHGMDALMLASLLGRYETAISLLEAGADINTADAHGWTPLHYATYGGNTDVMDLLIANNTSLETETSTGYTPLSLAVSMNNFKAARLLIGYGANVNTRISPSLNPLTLARENKNDSLVNMLRNQNAKAIHRPYFNQVTIGTDFIVNRDDKHLGFSFGFSDKKYKLMTQLSYGFRLNAIQVLEQTSAAEFYQYWERRHFISLAVEKAFYMPAEPFNLKTGIFAGFGEVLTFGGYRGADAHPRTRLLINPRIGVIIDYRFLRFKCDYEFLDQHLKKINRTWVNVSLEVLFRRKRGSIKPPTVNWF